MSQRPGKFTSLVPPYYILGVSRFEHANCWLFPLLVYFCGFPWITSFGNLWVYFPWWVSCFLCLGLLLIPTQPVGFFQSTFCWWPFASSSIVEHKESATWDEPANRPAQVFFVCFLLITWSKQGDIVFKAVFPWG